MPILLVFTFVSGLVTILAPCIWPLLPVVLSSSATGGRRKPLGITLGILVSFAFFTLTISYLVKLFPFNPNSLRLFAVVVIVFLGLTLIVPKLTRVVESWVSMLSGRFGSKISNQGDGFLAGIITGGALGIVWTPCAGPILATIATLAATRAVNAAIFLVTIVYVAGIGIPLFAFASFGRNLFTKSRLLSRHTGRIQQIFGIIMLLTALAIYTNFDKTLQAKLLDKVPAYSTFLYKLEGSTAVTKELSHIKGDGPLLGSEPITLKDVQERLPIVDTAPEFTGIAKWLNVDHPLTIDELKGKVVLVDFWTYTCINCIRTLPFVTSWYEKYKDQGFVVVGVHTPEFEFEKDTNNVQAALKQRHITYPVAQDNDYKTWNAYNNRYWPAKYLIDTQGKIRYYHFGEGNYTETEMAIQSLLKEAGIKSTMPKPAAADQTPQGPQTPETYINLLRLENFASKKKPQKGPPSILLLVSWIQVATATNH